MNFVGLDVHRRFTYGVVKNEQGEVLNKARFDNSEENFDSFLRDFPPEETEIVMESTGVWECLYDMLESKGYRVKLANPVKTKAIASARVKTDAIDAATLADLLRGNLIAESYVPSKEIRKLRDVVRQRKTLVKGRTQIKNRIRAILIRHGIKLPYETLCESAIAWILEEIKDLSIKTILVSYINLLKDYNHELASIEEKIENKAWSDEKAKLLMTMPGIGPIRAMEILAEIADINRFENASKLCSYAGLVPSIKQSGSTLRFGRLVLQSSKALKNTMIEAAWVAVSKTREANPLKLYYKKLCKKKSKQKAICATARKMLCIAYAMLRKNQQFMIL
jgi:transposase